MAIHSANVAHRSTSTPGGTTSARRLPRRTALAAAAAVTALVLSGCWSPAQDKDLGFINQARRSNGRAFINGDAALMARAEAWAEHMSQTGRLEHSAGGGNVSTRGLSNWCGVAENVAYASTTQEAHQAFMNSPAHRVNVLGDYDRVGTGVARRGGTVWVAEIYVRSC